MAVKYKTIPKINPQDPQGVKKHYGIVVTSGEKNIKQIGKDIADISSLSFGDIQNVLTNLILQLPKYLADGQNVKLGEFGNFRISVSSDGVDNDADFKASHIKGAKIIFTPGKDLKETLKNLKFEKA